MPRFSRWRWMRLLCVLAVFFPAISALAADEHDAYAQLEALLREAPARQIGQPGNEAIDRIVRERFEQLVREQNDPQRFARAKQAWEQSQQAHKRVIEAVNDAQVVAATSGKSIESPLFVKATLEEPAVVVWGLIVVLAMLLTAWRMQKRQSLLILGGVIVAMAIALPLIAHFVETEAERAAKDEASDVRTAAGLMRTVDNAAREALKADSEAQQAMAGMWLTGRIEHPAAAFIPGKITLGNERGAQVPVHQLAPNLVEPGNLPTEGFTGRLVYVGRAMPADLAQRELRGAAVLIEFDSENRWLETVQLGADVVIFVEPADKSISFKQAAAKLTNTPLSVPRLYLKREQAAAVFGDDFARTLREGRQITLKQELPGRWENRDVATDWLFIPGVAPSQSDARFEDDLSRQLVIIQAYKDSSSIVPELSPGAQSAANIVMLLRMAEQFRVQRPSRPVLLVAVNDHANAMTGEQVFAFNAFANPPAIREELNEVWRDLARERFIAQVYRLTPDDELIEKLRGWRERIGGQAYEIKTPIATAISDQRNELRERRSRAEVRLRSLRETVRRSGRSLTDMTVAEKAQSDALIGEIETARDQIAELRLLASLFNRLGEQTRFNDLSPAQQQRVSEYFATIAGRAERAAAQLDRTQNRIVENLALRRILRPLQRTQVELASDEPRFAGIFDYLCHPLEPVVMLTLDMSFGSDRVGFFTHGQLRVSGLFDSDAIKRVIWLAPRTVRIAEDYAAKTGQTNLFVDTLTNDRGLPHSAHLTGDFAIAARTAHQYDRIGFTLASVRDTQPVVFTPHDTLANIDRRNFDAVMKFTQGYLATLVDAADFRSTTAFNSSKISVFSGRISVRSLDKFSVTIPQQTVENALVVAAYFEPGGARYLPMLGQVRHWPIHLTDVRGNVIIRGMPWQGPSLQVFTYDDDYSQITGVLDFNQGERRLASTISVAERTIYKTQSVAVFEARKVDIVGLTEPLTLRPVMQVDVVDARQNSLPQFYATAGVAALPLGKTVPLSRDGTGSIFVTPETQFTLRLGRSVAINATVEDAQSGRPKIVAGGFNPQMKLLRDMVTTVVRDESLLSKTRLDILRVKGVVNETAQHYIASADEIMAQVAMFAEQDRHEEALTAAEEARGLSHRAYTRGLDTINDLIKAVVVFLALVIPFCFFLMKLITPFTDVNRQLAMFAGIFAVMAAVLYMVHPAFDAEVAAQPHVIVLGFIIFGLAAFVSTVLVGRFNASMNQAVEESLMAETMDAPQGRLLGVAFMVGVNNMKRRRIRTTLTCATIVLVTFTMLSVISVKQDVEPAQIRLSSDAPYNGFLFTRSGLDAIEETQMRRLRAHFRDGTVTVNRTWSQRQGSFGEYIPYDLEPSDPMPDARVRRLEAKVLLGLQVAEHGQVTQLPLTPGSQWFSNDDAKEIVLSVAAAKLLGITPQNLAGQEIRLLGHRLKLVGLVDDAAMEKIRDLEDVPLLPLLTQADLDTLNASSAAQSQEEAAGTAVLSTGGDVLSKPGTTIARAQDVAIVPIDFARQFANGTYRALSVKYEVAGSRDASGAAKAAWDAANRLIQFNHSRVAVGLTTAADRGVERKPVDPGQYALASSSATEVGGILKIAIPIILAATIILNTMLGSVMERRREVGIYNAIGLNPTHVMIFFLAESLVFGVVGAVAGYLIGQILSVLIINTGLIELNLNYSSVSVIVVILLTVGTVLLSTVYPATMAARAAVPSGQRRWALPQPVGNEIHVKFPFSYDADRVLGICAYLHEYMRQNTDASTGKFLAKLGPVGRVTGSVDEQSSGKAYAMVFDVAPAPFDLGVNQKVEVYAYYDSHVKAHMLSVHLIRVSGDYNSWLAVNQPFLESLRKRLLGWRSQTDATQQTFFTKGEQMFSTSRDLPVTQASAT